MMSGNQAPVCVRIQKSVSGRSFVVPRGAVFAFVGVGLLVFNMSWAMASTGCTAIRVGGWNFFTNTSGTKVDNFSKGDQVQFTFYNFPFGQGGKYSFTGSLRPGKSGGGNKIVKFKVRKTGRGTLTIINVDAPDYAVASDCLPRP
jgi:hypothetical protein